MDSYQTDDDNLNFSAPTDDRPSLRKKNIIGLFGLVGMLVAFSWLASAFSAPNSADVPAVALSSSDLLASASSTKNKDATKKLNTCLEGKCNSFFAAIAMSWSDPIASGLVKCLTHSDASTASACFPHASARSLAMNNLYTCALCHSCMAGSVVKPSECAKLPSGWNDLRGPPANTPGSQYLPPSASQGTQEKGKPASGADWREYIPSNYNKPEAGDWSQYIPSAQSTEPGASQYIPSDSKKAKKDSPKAGDWSHYIPGAQTGKSGQAADAPWSHYIPTGQGPQKI